MSFLARGNIWNYFNSWVIGDIHLNFHNVLATVVQVIIRENGQCPKSIVFFSCLHIWAGIHLFIYPLLAVTPYNCIVLVTTVSVLVGSTLCLWRSAVAAEAPVECWWSCQRNARGTSRSDGVEVAAVEVVDEQEDSCGDQGHVSDRSAVPVASFETRSMPP